MKKQLKLSLAATAVAVTVIGTGLTSYAMAQERIRSAGAQGGPISTGPAAASRLHAEKSNGVINFLKAAIWSSQDSYLSRTSNNTAIGQIIEASNRATFAMLTPAQQKVQEEELQIDRFAPDKKLWRDIAATKSIVNALLTVSSDQEKLANGIESAIWDKISHPTDQVKADSGLLGLSQNEKLRELANPSESKPVQQHRRWLDKQYVAGCEQVRASLSADQKKEWDAIWALYQRYLPKTVPQ